MPSFPRLLTVITISLLTGCGVYECIDETFIREPITIQPAFAIELRLNKQRVEKQVVCEHYYDAMCAERGNFWAFREKGFKHLGQTSKFVISDPELGTIELGIPPCQEMARGRPYPLKYVILTIKGEKYWLESSTGNLRTYATSTAHRDSVKKTAILHLDLLVNGQPLN